MATSTSQSCRARIPQVLRFGFSLRAMLLITAVTALVPGYVAIRLRERRAARTVVECGGIVRYDWQSEEGDYDGRTLPLFRSENPTGPGWLRAAIGDDWFQHVERVSLFNDKTTDRAVACLSDFPRLCNRSLARIREPAPFS